MARTFIDASSHATTTCPPALIVHQPPLIKPYVRYLRIRLSDVLHYKACTERAIRALKGLERPRLWNSSCLALQYSFLCSVLILFGVVSDMAIPLILRSLVAWTKQGPFPRSGLCCPTSSNGTMNPSDSRHGPSCFRYLIHYGRWPPHHHNGSPALGNKSAKTCRPCYPERKWMPLPFFKHPASGLPLVSTGSASPNRFTRLRIGSLALRPAFLLFGNSRPCVTTTPLPHTTRAYGQLPGRDFNPLDLLLLLRTDTARIFKPVGQKIQEVSLIICFLFVFQVFIAGLSLLSYMYYMKYKHYKRR